MIIQRIRKSYFKTLKTSVTNSPMSLPSLRVVSHPYSLWIPNVMKLWVPNFGYQYKNIGYQRNKTLGTNTKNIGYQHNKTLGTNTKKTLGTFSTLLLFLSLWNLFLLKILLTINNLLNNNGEILLVTIDSWLLGLF